MGVFHHHKSLLKASVEGESFAGPILTAGPQTYTDLKMLIQGHQGFSTKSKSFNQTDDSLHQKKAGCNRNQRHDSTPWKEGLKFNRQPFPNAMVSHNDREDSLGDLLDGVGIA